MLEQTIQSNHGKRSRWLGAIAACGLLAAGVLGTACGDVDGPDVDISAPTTSATTAAQALDRNPVSDYFDGDGNYFLECHTGADLGPIQVTPNADVNGWMSTCMDGLLGESGPGATDAEVAECRQDVLDYFGRRHAVPSGHHGDTPLKSTPPTTWYSYDGNWWTICNTGADIDHFMHTGDNGDAYDAWVEDCLSYSSGGGGGPGVGVAHPVLHRELAGRTGGSSSGSTAGNPVCKGLMGDRVEARTSGFVYACSSTHQISRAGMSGDEFRIFAQECKNNGNGSVSEMPFFPGKQMNEDILYVCSTTGQTIQHKDGYRALKSFQRECSANDGNVLYRSFNDPEVGDYIRYFCSSTGETLPHSDGQGAYEAFGLDCLQRGGQVFSNVDYAYTEVEPSEPIGRGGRDDATPLKRDVISAHDANGDHIYVCIPDGGWISGDVSYQEYVEFEAECKNGGGSIAAWRIYPRASIERRISR